MSSQLQLSSRAPRSLDLLLMYLMLRPFNGFYQLCPKQCNCNIYITWIDTVTAILLWYLPQTVYTYFSSNMLVLRSVIVIHHIQFENKLLLLLTTLKYPGQRFHLISPSTYINQTLRLIQNNKMYLFFNISRFYFFASRSHATQRWLSYL